VLVASSIIHRTISQSSAVSLTSRPYAFHTGSSFHGTTGSGAGDTSCFCFGFTASSGLVAGADFVSRPPSRRNRFVKLKNASMVMMLNHSYAWDVFHGFRLLSGVFSLRRATRSLLLIAPVLGLTWDE
jgi:hypothetical protein